MLINTFLDTEDFVHLYYPEDEPPAAQGCGAGARMASKYPPRPPSPEYSQVATPSTSEMSDRERYRAPPQPEPPPHRVRAADLYPRLRTHYDEPGLDVPFAPICGEFVQWVGRMADGGVIAMSNYRLHSQPKRRNGPGASIPTRLIDALEIRDLLHLIVLCKNGRQLKCSFNTGDQCVEWWRRLNTAMAPMSSVQETFAAAYAAWAKEQPASSVHRALLRASHAPQTDWFGLEVERLGFTAKGAWRVTTANEKYELCPSYPPLLVVPASVCDEDLDAVATFRAMRRIPTVVWRHRGNGAVIARSSQPEVGWFGWRSAEDEQLLAAFVTACNADRGLQHPNNNKQLKLLIVDARSYASAVTNRARGGGCEYQQYYPNADIQFMSMPNIHHVRRSFQQMRALAAEPSDQANWLSNLERTLWLQYVAGISRAASTVCRAVLAGRPVLVHCSDGWDRTPQICAAAQLVLDPYYRTLEGFRVLIESEWLGFGHKFADRCGHQFGAESPNERSPIFLQWLDWVHQVAVQHPCSFEFNEAYLIKLATHVHSCMFGTFLCNDVRERAELRDAPALAAVWPLLRAPAYRNHLYSPHRQDQVLWPDYSVRSTQVWVGMFGGESGAAGELDDPRLQCDLPRQANTNGMMTKTRSCDNLLSDGEKRTAQRRCSDPNISPDVMKLSMVVNECDSRRECRSALTDSCVDELPVLPLQPDSARDQVDGLHPDHFESPRLPRDIASGSSSLERELCAPAAGPRGAAHAHAGAPDADSPDEPPVFVCDTYTEVIGMAEAARESARTRNISITWRSISESSTQSSTGFDIADTHRADASLPESRAGSHESSPMDTHNVTHGDIANHNVMDDDILNGLNGSVNGVDRSVNGVDRSVNGVDRSVNGVDGSVNGVDRSVNGVDRSVNGVDGSVNGVDRSVNGVDGTVNGVNGIEDVQAKFLEVDLNGGATSSSLSSESEGEAAAPRAHGRAARGSQLTLCPTSPRRFACCHCSRRPSTTSGVETSGSSGSGAATCWCGVCGDAVGGARVRCVCGAAAGAEADPLDGLPPATDPLQKVVEELSGQLREAREALRLSSPAPLASSPALPHPASSPPNNTQKYHSGSTSVGSSSGSGSASEVEVGEEARGVVWLPDSAAPRCQHCHHHFWLARRRHHCRRCGGIFCGSCSEMSPWGECGAVRVCRRCRALR